MHRPGTKDPSAWRPRTGGAAVAALTLLLVLPLPWPEPVIAQSTTYFEGFESPDMNGDPPQEDWYTFTTSGTGAFRVATDRFKTGAQSYRQSSISPSSTSSGIFTLAFDPCAANTDTTVKFWYQLQDATTANSFDILRLSKGGTDNVHIHHQSDGNVRLGVSGGDADTLLALHNPADDTWYEIELRLNCEQAIVNAFVFDAAGAEINNILVDENGALESFDRMTTGSHSTNGPVWFDDIRFINAQDAPPELSPLTEETFETDTVGGEPADFWYLTSFQAGGTAVVATDRAIVGSRSLKVTSGAGAYNLFFAGSVELCPGDSGVRVWWQSDTVPAASDHATFGPHKPGATEFARFQTDSGGQQRAISEAGAGLTVVNLFQPLPDTWYLLSIKILSCAEASAVYEVFNADGSLLVRATVDAAGSWESMKDYLLASHANEGSAWFDQLEVLTDGENVVSPSAIATVSGLVGFDVDPGGGLAIARTDAGENVRVWNALGLGNPVGGPVDTNCATGTNPYEDGVMAKNPRSGNPSQLVAFLNCDAAGDAQFLSIRQADGSVPTAQQFEDLTGETCEPGANACPFDIDLASLFEPADSGLGELGQVQDFPIDWSVNDEEAFNADRRTVAWGFASQQCDQPPGPAHCADQEPGQVGVVAYTARTIPPDIHHQDQAQHSPGQTVDDFCLGLDGGSYYLASAVSGQLSHTWPVTFTAQSDGSFEVDLGAQTSFGNSQSGMACGGGQILTLDGSNAINLYTRQGNFISGAPITTGAKRGVAISEEFLGPSAPVTQQGNPCVDAMEGIGGCVQYGAFVDAAAGRVRIVNLTGGQISGAATVALPTGTFRGLWMDRTAQNLWIATGVRIVVFGVTLQTTDTEVSPLPGGAVGGGAPPATTAPGIIGQIEEAGEESGLGDVAFKALAGFVAVGMAWIFCMFAAASAKLPAVAVSGSGIAGAVMGFGLAWQFGFFASGLVFLIVFVIGSLVVLRFSGGGG